MVTETVGLACSCCNSVAGPSQTATHGGCARAGWALLPSRGRRGCFGTMREFIGDLAHVFPVRSTSFFLLSQQNHTSSTPKCEGFSPPAQPLYGY